MLRTPAVAGQFYPGSPSQLASMIQSFIDSQVTPQPAILAICPHAGYVYSGATAAKVLGRIAIPRRVVVAGPNHRGAGHPVAVMSKGAWETPLGQVDLDAELGAELLAQSDLVAEDETAHRMEHSLEVQVPILQYFRSDFLLTPLCLSHLDLASCLELGKALARAVTAVAEPVLMVSSTDMTHYEPAEQAKAKDDQALKHVLDLDPEGLYNTVRSQRISMCGVLPTAVCLAAAKQLGAASAQLVEYTNSGAVSGDYQQVVGYAGLIVN
ncbi:MAG: AmmeMemoRadiSam system protein B [Desulfarculaceae bacterium]|jgi:AmmeMemoRadiSam system protein B